MITVCCDKCGTELSELGGVAFSPPVKLRNGLVYRPQVVKIHLCKKCWYKFMKWLNIKRKHDKDDSRQV